MTHSQAQELINFLFFVKIVIGIWTAIALAATPICVVFIWQVVREFRKAQKERKIKMQESAARARDMGAFSL